MMSERVTGESVAIVSARLPAWALLVALLGVAWQAEAGPVPEVTASFRSIAEIKDVSDAEVRSKPRVVIRGVVTWREEQGRVLYLQDETAGVYTFVPRLNPTPWLPDAVQSATLVEASGFVVLGGFAPSLQLATIRVIGPAPLPEPLPFEFARFATGADNCSLVEVAGVVQGVREEPKVWRLFAANEFQRFEVECRKAAMPPDFGEWCLSLVNGRVRVRGVSSASFNARGELLLPRLLVGEAGWIEPVALPDHEPFGSPQVSIDAVARYRAEPLAAHMVRTAGTVVHAVPGEAVFLQEGLHGLRVLTRSREHFLPGDHVEVAGFVDRGGSVAGLTEAVVRRLSSGSPPEPVNITPDEVAAVHERSADRFVIAQPGDYEGCLVRFPARLLERKPGQSRELLVLAAGETSVTARIPTADLTRLPGLEAGSELLVTGILRILPASEPASWPLTRPSRMEVAPRSAADVTILSQPPWWTPRRLALLLAGASATLMVALAWGVALRRQVRRQMREIEDGLRMEAVAEERQRIAREFHDTLEQGLAALSLRLGVAASRTADEQARGVLRQQKTLLSWLQTETREFLEDLRDTTHAEEPLGPTLTGHVEQLRSLCPVPIELAIEPGLPDVSAAVQHHLARIVREAVYNAIRHGEPSNVLVRLAAGPRAGEIDLEIRDDGRGFEVSRGAELPGHYGIRGMQERARRVGAHLEIESEPGQGTRVFVSIPAQLPVSTIAGLGGGSP